MTASDLSCDQVQFIAVLVDLMPRSGIVFSRCKDWYRPVWI